MSYGYTSSNGWIVTATATTNLSAPSSPPSSPNQQREPVTVMYAAFIKTFEETLGHAFQEDTGYPYQSEARV